MLAWDAIPAQKRPMKPPLFDVNDKVDYLEASGRMRGTGLNLVHYYYRQLGLRYNASLCYVTVQCKRMGYLSCLSHPFSGPVEGCLNGQQC